MVKIHNPYEFHLSAAIVDATGNIDGVHIQPRATISLPRGWELHQNSQATYPRLQRISDLPAPAMVFDTPNAISLTSQIATGE